MQKQNPLPRPESRLVQLASSLTLAATVVAASLAGASSHREAPFVTEHPKVDGTDFYLFRSYEPGREGYVTLIANYNPLQDAYGGPNYFTLDPSARYRIHVDNDGDSVEDLTFEFRFLLFNQNIELNVGGENVPIPLLAAAPLVTSPGGLAGANQAELFTVRRFRGETTAGPAQASDDVTVGTNATRGGVFFAKPFDHHGLKTFPDYDGYADLFMHDVDFGGGCSGRVFAGQRREAFAVNLGEVFDLVNLDPLGDRDGAGNATEFKNVTSLALELPIDCLTEGNGDVLGAWTTALLPKVRRLEENPT
ncbi:MAG: DUF4331 domain-containing protein, partial [Acidobacteriota bacterium]